MYYICHNNSIASSKWLTTHLNLAVVHNLGHLSTVTLKSVGYLLNLGSLYFEFPTPVFSISVRDLVSLWSKNFLCEALLRHCLSRVRHWLVQATLHHWFHHFSRFFSSSFFVTLLRAIVANNVKWACYWNLLPNRFSRGQTAFQQNDKLLLITSKFALSGLAINKSRYT